MNFKNIIVLAPHTDDAELGCGGTIARFIKEGLNVKVVVFSTAVESLPVGSAANKLELEFRNSMNKMNLKPKNIEVHHFPVRKLNFHRQEILELMVQLKKEFNPDLVIIPSSEDVHQDHQVIQAEGLRAFKDVSVLGYELPWNHITFTTQFFIKLEREDIEKKWEALKEYKTQLELKRGYFTNEFIFGLAKVRGTQIKEDYAEAFEVFRLKY